MNHAKDEDVSNETTPAPPRPKRAPKFKPRKDAMDPKEPTRQRDPRKPSRKPEGEPDFRPKAKSTVFPPPKTDPMDIDQYLVLKLKGMTPISPPRSIQLNYSGYFDLMDALYNELKVKDVYWSTKVSHAMFYYYGTMLLWQRLIYIQCIQGDREMSSYINYKTYMPIEESIPQALSSYLSSIGPIVDPNKRKWLISVPEITNDVAYQITGWFGPITSDSHYLYGMTPSPGVAALSVLFESAGENSPRDWDLPLDIRPALQSALLPTLNLLGYRKNENTSVEIWSTYAQYDVEATWDEDTAVLEEVTFGEVIEGLPVNKKLLRMISEHLAESGIPLHKGPVETTCGSQSLLGFVLTRQPETSLIPRPMNRSTQNTVAARCYTQLVSARGNAIAVCKPRVRFCQHYSSYIYSFTNNRVVQGWIATVNDGFEDQAAILNTDEFGLTEVNGEAAAAAFVKNISSRG
nr:MAG: capsid protein [Ezimos virus]